MVEAVHPGVGPARLQACLGDPGHREPDEVAGGHGGKKVSATHSWPGRTVDRGRPVGRAEAADECGEGGLVDRVDHPAQDKADPGVVPVPPCQQADTAGGTVSQRRRRMLRQRFSIYDWGERQRSPPGRVGRSLDLPGDR